MSLQHRVLLVGGTGRTGGRVLTQLLGRGVAVRAIVRSAARLPEGVAGDPLLTVVEADLLSLSTEELQRHLEGCDTVISCLGHTISLSGVLGPPFDLVVRAVSNLARAVEAMRPAEPVRFILMSTVSVNRPEKADTRRGAGERLFLWRAARASCRPRGTTSAPPTSSPGEIGPSNPYVEWVAVRPDTLLEGDVTDYRAARRTREQHLPARRDEHGQRRALHVRARYRRSRLAAVEGRHAGDRERRDERCGGREQMTLTTREFIGSDLPEVAGLLDTDAGLWLLGLRSVAAGKPPRRARGRCRHRVRLGGAGRFDSRGSRARCADRARPDRCRGCTSAQAWCRDAPHEAGVRPMPRRGCPRHGCVRVGPRACGRGSACRRP